MSTSMIEVPYKALLHYLFFEGAVALYLGGEEILSELETSPPSSIVPLMFLIMLSFHTSLEPVTWLR